MRRFAARALVPLTLVIGLSTLSSCGADGPSETQILSAAATHLDTGSSADAATFVELVAVDADPRWAPWLLDLLRLGRHSLLNERIGEVLADMSGIPSDSRVPDLVAHGGWARREGLDGGAGYRAFKLELYDWMDVRFAPLLESVADDETLAAIDWGGVPFAGIPHLDEPAHLDPVDAPWLVDDEVVLGLELGGEAVAYPLRIIEHHELVNDTVGGRPVVIVYCSLCRSGTAHLAEVDGRAVDFATSGLLLDSNKLMADLETGTLWHHLRAVAISGPEAGATLQALPVEQRTWADWLADHPTTGVIDLPEPIFFDNPERPPIAYDYSPGAAYPTYRANDDLWFPVGEQRDDLATKATVIGIDHEGAALALELSRLPIGRGVEVVVGGSRFDVTSTGPGAIVTDADGDVVVTEQMAWFAWVDLHPSTEVWAGP